MRKFAALLAIASGFFAAPVAQAVPITYAATLTGLAEAPPNSSPAIGSVLVTIDTDTGVDTLIIAASWSGLTTPVTAAHIHCCTAVPLTGTVAVAVGPTTLFGFPSGAGSESGSYQETFSTLNVNVGGFSTYTGGFITNFGGGTVQGAETALAAGLANGTAYFNIHTSEFPGGEIRGFLQRVPEPASFALLGLGLLGLGLNRKFMR